MLDSKDSLRGINQEPVNHPVSVLFSGGFDHHSDAAVFSGLLRMRMSCNSQGYPQIQPADGELFQRVLGTLTGGLLGVLLIVRLWAEALPLPRRHVGSFDLAPRTGTRRPLGLRRNPWSPSRENPTLSVNRTPLFNYGSNICTERSGQFGRQWRGGNSRFL